MRSSKAPVCSLLHAMLCALLVLPLPAAANEAQEKDSLPPAAAKAGQHSTATPAPEDSQNEESAGTATAVVEPSPYEYEASEQISEDRSVSFPVDI